MAPPSWTGESLRSSAGREVRFGTESRAAGIFSHVVSFGSLDEATYLSVEAKGKEGDSGLVVEAIAIDPRFSDSAERFPSRVSLEFSGLEFPPRPGSEAQYLDALRGAGILALDGLDRILTINMDGKA